MNFSARIFSFVLLFLFGSLLFIKPAFAQTVTPPQNLHNYTQNVMIEVASSVTCMITGIDAINPSQKCLGIANGKIGPVDSKGGAIGTMGNLIAMTFNIPLHTGDYFGYLASDFGVAKPAYAQGIGFNSLSPLTDIWVAFRNIVYILFVLVFVIIGFAIMFRVHIDPRTVMTIENQIPKIIIGLILVTLSLAVAGFLIDLMWVLCYLVIQVFAGIDPSVNAVVTSFQGQNALEVANNIHVSGLGGSTGFIGIVTNSSGAVKDIIGNIFSGTGGTIVGDFLTGIFTYLLLTFGKAAPVISGIINLIPGVGGAVGKIIAGLTIGVASSVFSSQILAWLGGIVAFVVIAVAVLFALFRLWFALLKAYIFILINIVFAPFWIIAGLVPGSKISFTGWLRDMAGNLLAYPATLMMFLLAQVFINKFGTTQTNGQFVPPLIGNPGQPNAIGGLIGLGMILLTPGVVDMARKILQAPEADLSALAKSIGVGMGVGGLPMSTASMGYQLHMASQFGPFKALGERVGLLKAQPQTKP